MGTPAPQQPQGSGSPLVSCCLGCNDGQPPPRRQRRRPCKRRPAPRSRRAPPPPAARALSGSDPWCLPRLCWAPEGKLAAGEAVVGGSVCGAGPRPDSNPAAPTASCQLFRKGWVRQEAPGGPRDRVGRQASSQALGQGRRHIPGTHRPPSGPQQVSHTCASTPGSGFGRTGRGALCGLRCFAQVHDLCLHNNWAGATRPPSRGDRSMRPCRPGAVNLAAAPLLMHIRRLPDREEKAAGRTAASA